MNDTNSNSNSLNETIFLSTITDNRSLKETYDTTPESKFFVLKQTLDSKPHLITVIQALLYILNIHGKRSIYGLWEVVKSSTEEIKQLLEKQGFPENEEQLNINSSSSKPLPKNFVIPVIKGENIYDRISDIHFFGLNYFIDYSTYGIRCLTEAFKSIMKENSWDVILKENLNYPMEHQLRFSNSFKQKTEEFRRIRHIKEFGPKNPREKITIIFTHLPDIKTLEEFITTSLTNFKKISDFVLAEYFTYIHFMANLLSHEKLFEVWKVENPKQIQYIIDRMDTSTIRCQEEILKRKIKIRSEMIVQDKGVPYLKLFSKGKNIIKILEAEIFQKKAILDTLDRGTNFHLKQRELGMCVGARKTIENGQGRNDNDPYFYCIYVILKSLKTNTDGASIFKQYGLTPNQINEILEEIKEFLAQNSYETILTIPNIHPLWRARTKTEKLIPT